MSQGQCHGRAQRLHQAASRCLLSGWPHLHTHPPPPTPGHRDWPGLGLHDSRDLLSCNRTRELRGHTGLPGRAHSLAPAVSMGSVESRVQSWCPGERGPPSGKRRAGGCRGSSPTGVSSGRLNRAMFPLSKKCGAKLAWAAGRGGAEHSGLALGLPHAGSTYTGPRLAPRWPHAAPPRGCSHAGPMLAPHWPPAHPPGWPQALPRLAPS